MRESQDEEVNPKADFENTANCVEENCHLKDRLGIILVGHCFGYRVGEERDDTLNDSHEEEYLEDELEFSANVRSLIQFVAISSVVVQSLIIGVIRVAVDWVIVETQGEVAIDNSKEDCVDKAWWWTRTSSFL